VFCRALSRVGRLVVNYVNFLANNYIDSLAKLLLLALLSVSRAKI
jgi:hypothetical protein